MKTFKQYFNENINPRTGYEPREDDKFWRGLEKDVQDTADKKDPKFVLKGPWKKFYKNVDGFRVYIVNGEWVYNNLSIIYGHGGHGFVHEFIPKSEIWVASHHPKDCHCKGVSKDRKATQEFIDSTIIHEIEEFKRMSRGMPYFKAHTKANKAEIDAKLLKMPDDQS